METKSLFTSKTIIGVVIAALPTILGLFGISVSDLPGFTANVDQIANGLVELFGSGLAIYGRIKATTALVVKK